MPSPRPVTAVLGPTNTGKTHLAVERMLAHGAGMIGLPLRLLAREIYDRVKARAGEAAVALVTGEEKIIPAAPRYWIATVEAMPPQVEVPFLAIDEIQLCADFERGHIFTDRLLHRRGLEETMLLGAATMRGIIEQLLPKTVFISRPRFSKLTYAGPKKITRLPRRSAIVAFSAETVYAVAELIRRQSGGAAVVLGALSPRTRNAQVALYQSGDVNYIVATDAIGMGLNMDVDHVAFAATRKFDGFQYRQLSPAELGQIAGRAGRYMNDGTFGVTADADPFDQETIDRLENHNFESVRMLQWRNRDLDFSSIDSLRQSLLRPPRQQGLTRAQASADVLALESVARDSDVVALASTCQDVELLWDICQLPDYRNISSAEHAHLVARIFQFLKSPLQAIPEDWLQRQLSHCNRTDGDIDTLSNRISHVRTWTYLANRSGWLKDPAHWQQRTRDIEDRLSDALHERLTQRFIDRRTSVLMKRLAQKEELMSTVEEDGAIHVEGEYVGRVKGLSFIADGSGDGAEARVLKAAAVQAVAAEIGNRAKALAVSPDTELKLNLNGRFVWNHAEVGKIELGATVLKPLASVISGDQLQPSDREAVQARLQRFLDRHIAATLEPLIKLEEGEGLEGLARGIAFRLVESLGVLAREQVADDVKSLSQDDRAKLRALGVRFGAFHLFTPALLKPAATELRLLLWALQKKLDLLSLPKPPQQGLTSVVFDRSTPVGFYGVCGYRICGNRAVRVDMLERLADLIRERVFWRPLFPEQQRPAGSVEGGGFVIIPDMMSLVGCSGEEFQGILRSLGFRMQKKKVPVAVTPATAEVPAAHPEPVTPESAEGASKELPEIRAEDTIVNVVDIASPNEGASTATAAVEAVAADSAETELQVWWPKDTGPFRRKHEHKAEKPRQPRKQHGKSTEKPAKVQRPHRPPRAEKPIDPDSPFAVLGALKAKLSGGRS